MVLLMCVGTSAMLVNDRILLTLDISESARLGSLNFAFVFCCYLCSAAICGLLRAL